MTRTAARDLLARFFNAERAAGFPTLSRIPSTMTVRFLDFFADLSKPEQDELVPHLVERGASYLCPPVPLPPQPPVESTYGRFLAAMEWRGFGGGRRCTPIKLLAGIAKDTHVGGVDGWCRSMGFAARLLEPSADLFPAGATIAPVTAAGLKKRLSAALQKLFAPEVRGIGDGMWSYRGTLDGCLLTLLLTYGKRLADPDLKYSLIVDHRGRRTSNLTCFEALFGAGLGWWDYLTEENAERSVALFCELLRTLARLVAELPPDIGT